MTNYFCNQAQTAFKLAYSTPYCKIWQMDELLLNSTSPTPPRPQRQCLRRRCRNSRYGFVEGTGWFVG